MKTKTIENILLEYDPEEKNLLPALKKISAVFGFVMKEQAEKVADYFSCPLSQVFEIGSFYDEIKFKKPPEILIEICSSPTCAVNASLQLVEEIENYFKIKLNGSENSKIHFQTMSCLGRCGQGPILRINGEIFSEMSRSRLHEILEKIV